MKSLTGQHATQGSSEGDERRNLSDDITDSRIRDCLTGRLNQEMRSPVQFITIEIIKLGCVEFPRLSAASTLIIPCIKGCYLVYAGYAGEYLCQVRFFACTESGYNTDSCNNNSSLQDLRPLPLK